MDSGSAHHHVSLQKLITHVRLNFVLEVKIKILFDILILCPSSCNTVRDSLKLYDIVLNTTLADWNILYQGSG